MATMKAQRKGAQAPREATQARKPKQEGMITVELPGAVHRLISVLAEYDQVTVEEWIEGEARHGADFLLDASRDIPAVQNKVSAALVAVTGEEVEGEGAAVEPDNLIISPEACDLLAALAKTRSTTEKAIVEELLQRDASMTLNVADMMIENGRLGADNPVIAQLRDAASAVN